MHCHNHEGGRRVVYSSLYCSQASPPSHSHSGAHLEVPHPLQQLFSLGTPACTGLQPVDTGAQVFKDGCVRAHGKKMHACMSACTVQWVRADVHIFAVCPPAHNPSSPAHSVQVGQLQLCQHLSNHSHKWRVLIAVDHLGETGNWEGEQIKLNSNMQAEISADSISDAASIN